jgi:hypothetical protein
MDTVAPSGIDGQPGRRPPAVFFALGQGQLPPEITADGATWQRRQAFKHDFYAATGLYERVSGSSGSRFDWPRWAVLKVQRTHSFFGLPMRWLGVRLARREIAIYQALQGVPGIPRFLGAVGPTGFLHEYIPGRDLRSSPPLTAAFFDQFQKTLSDMHQRYVAYVDCNKRENILLGEDGRPWLIDFQISYQVRGGARGGPLARWWFRRFVRADWYHFYKHKTRLLPEACSPEDFAKAQQRGMLHRLHRILTRPFVVARRRFLARYDLENARWH